MICKCNYMYLFGKLLLSVGSQVPPKSPHKCTCKLCLTPDPHQVRESIHGHANHCCFNHKVIGFHHPIQSMVEVIIEPAFQVGEFPW